MCKSVSVIFSLFIFFTTLGCVSNNGITVPGETKKIVKNISAEYYAIAEGYMDIKKYSKAAEYYQKAMREKSMYLQCYYKMARAYALGKDWENALKAYNFLLERDPDNIDINMSIAYILGMKGDTNLSMTMYKDLMLQYPNSQSLIENYIALLISVERCEDAEKQLYVLKEKFPDSKQISVYIKAIEDLIDNTDFSFEKDKESK